LRIVLAFFKKDKIPGLDGWTVEFFICFYELLEEYLLGAIEVKSIGKVSSSLNATFLALISKKDKLESFNEFRSISLCNCLYKIISKVLAIRVKTIFSYVISQEQFCFLANKQIYEAIRAAQQGIHSIKVKNRPTAVLKLGFPKAYNRTSWL
jgi:hypothetical protein